jgi:hypothetical protein
MPAIRRQSGDVDVVIPLVELGLLPFHRVCEHKHAIGGHLGALASYWLCDMARRYHIR